MAVKFRKAGRILRVKFGYNPNSSSLGADIHVLTWGVAFAAAAAVFVSALVRGLRRWKGRGRER